MMKKPVTQPKLTPNLILCEGRRWDESFGHFFHRKTSPKQLPPITGIFLILVRQLSSGEITQKTPHPQRSWLQHSSSVSQNYFFFKFDSVLKARGEKSTKQKFGIIIEQKWVSSNNSINFIINSFVWDRKYLYVYFNYMLVFLRRWNMVHETSMKRFKQHINSLSLSHKTHVQQKTVWKQSWMLWKGQSKFF